MNGYFTDAELARHQAHQIRGLPDDCTLHASDVTTKEGGGFTETAGATVLQTLKCRKERAYITSRIEGGQPVNVLRTPFTLHPDALPANYDIGRFLKHEGQAYEIDKVLAGSYAIMPRVDTKAVTI